MCIQTTLIMRKLFFVLAHTVIVFALANEPEQPVFSDTATSDNLFITTKVWEIHLGFTAENWEAMTPKSLLDSDTDDGIGIGWGGFIAPPFILEGDLDGDELLSKERI